ncbi:MAG TPA: ester cyclase [Gemmatimonadaceae bacterium]
MSAERARENFQRYIDSAHEDLSMMAEDVVFTNMATGDRHEGVEGVRQMLQYIYHVAFDAHAETRTVLVTEDHALLEGDFVGRHIAEFAGIPATGRNVRVPLCVVYDLENAMIKRGRVYFEVPALMQQLGVGPGAAAAAV